MSSNPLIRTIDIKDRNGRVVGTKDVVTYPGLLSKAHEEGLKEIQTTLVQAPTDQNGFAAIVKAIVVTEKGHFEGIGDANPENVNSFIVPHLIRMAETRANARALRDAVNIGVVSFEELDGEHDLGGNDEPARPAGSGTVTPLRRPRSNGSAGNGGQRREAPPRPARSSSDLMTEAQRRYLFRILAGQGLQTEAAHDYLKELLDVESLKDATKGAATQLIDRLLNPSEEEAAAHAHAEQ